jgi:nucleoid DNA-binding protein
MEKLISDLLLQNNSLIIPGFGSLIKSLSTGNITFNEFLKFNDGVLSAAIEKSKSVSKEEATKQIVGFATEVKSAIEKDGNYKLGSLGTFSKNEKGAIIFSGKVSTTASKPIPVVSPSVEKPKTEKVEKSLNEKLAEKAPPAKTIQQKAEEKEKKEKLEEKKEKKTKEQVISKPVTMSSHSHNDEHDENYVKLTQDEIEARHKKVAFRGTIIFGILAIVIIWFFNFINPHHDHGHEEGHDGTKTEEHGAPAHEMNEESNETSEVSIGEAANEEKEEALASSSTSNALAKGDPTNPAMEQSIPVNTINQKFYVVSASFSEASKAKHQARLLMIMDYKAVIINPESGKYYACTGGYNDYSEAQKALAEYKTKKASAWLFTP